MKKHIVIVANGFTEVNLSGGDKNFVELAKYLISGGYKVSIITNPVGQSVCVKNGLDKSSVNYILTDQNKKEIKNPLKIIWWYVKRGLKTKAIIKDMISNGKFEDDPYFVLSSDFYCDTLCLPSIKNHGKIIVFNMVAANPFYGYTGNLHFPKLNEIHYYLSNLFTFLLIRFFCPDDDKTNLVTTAKNIKDDLLGKKIIKKLHKRIKVINYGSDQNEIPSNPSKTFDFVWIGRNHKQKGIDDLKSIMVELKSMNPNYKMQVIGKVKDALQGFVKEMGLEKNVFLLGPVYGAEKMERLSEGKVFLFTSHFESFGIVVIENMLVGNLVVGYKIKSSLANFANRISFVNNFDAQMFAKTAHQLSETYEQNLDKVKSNKEFARKFTWENSYKEYLSVINKE